MARQIKTADAEALLAEMFRLAEEDHRDGAGVHPPAQVVADTERLFASETQAYREALIGCVIARVLDQEIDIRYPATEDGDNAFSGRSLADKVVTPFMRSKAVPISASPYLSSLRGGARFVEGGAPRIQRDKEGFDALVAVVEYVRDLNVGGAKSYLRYLLRCFVNLRDTANIALKRIAKPNLDQLQRLISSLLPIKSGGRFPSFLATAMFQTIGECHKLGWVVEFQGINVADKASGAVGDITVLKEGAIVLGVEVTERPIAKARVTQTFDQKVSPNALADYLFISTATPENDAVAAARKYTAVGHEMNFVPLAPWLIHNLSIVGPACRTLFQDKMIALVGAEGVPAESKVAWNVCMEGAIGLA